MLKNESLHHKLHLSIEELETLRWFQHNKEFEPYWAQITCILMLAHGHDAKNNLLRPWNKPIQRIQLCRGLYKSGGISKLTDNHYKGY